MFHSITLVGRLGAEPEVKTTKSGLKMASFSVAVDVKGKEKKVTIWPKVTAFGALSDIVSQYVHKGSTVLVEGRLSPDPATGAPKIYSKKDGTQGTSYDIIAEKVQVIGGDKQSNGNAGSDFDVDIPF